ncbi:MAG TPA: glycine cleavage T C-terminal barrel domain-containing protein, partial [Acetobacteraceae bacterium]
IAAALAASARGARVILCDEQAEPGGSLLSEPDATIDGWPAAEWLAQALGNLAQAATVLPRTTAFGWYPDNLIGLAERVTDHLADPDPDLPRERLWQVRAAEVVIAAGAIERPLVFPHNDRPGIMLAGAARTYLHRYGVLVGRRAVVAASDDDAYRAAIELHAAGLTIAAIVDHRAADGGEDAAAAHAAGIPVHHAATIVGTEGRLRVHSVKLSGGPGVIPCDTVLMSGGWTPSVHLFSQSRGRLRFDAASDSFLPGQSAARERSVGACAGTFGLAACLTQGYAAGGGGRRDFVVTGGPGAKATRVAPPVRPHRKAFVDFQSDVTTKDLRIAVQEGFRSIEHVKRYTTTGMATDQGKTSNLNALSAVADLLGRPMPDIGLTSFRPPYTPVTFGSFAGTVRGMLFDPVRHTPIAAPGAVFEDVGTWRRARYFPHAGETMQQAVARECLAVRNNVGVLDASTLGKIEVAGPDAAEFLNRLYTGNFTRLAAGRCRYALLLGEDGFIRDDGVVARLAQDRFHVTTTTGGAAAVLDHMEDYLQTEFSSLQVWLTSITEQWAVIAIQGPDALRVLTPLADGIDLAAMPHMAVREGRVAGVPARLFRVSFTGESGFEINVPAGHGQAVWDAVVQAGASFGITPYGTEAMHVLRAEKGYIIVGQDSDGTVTPTDLGLDWTIGRSKPDFVGKRSLVRPDMLRADRQQLVSLLTADPAMVPEEGAQLIADGQPPSVGHVTSAYWSATLGRSIALGLVAGGRARIGGRLSIPFRGRMIEVTVTDPIFYDRDGTRLRDDAQGGIVIPSVPPASPVTATPDPDPVVRQSGGLVRIAELAPTRRLSIRAGTGAATAIGAALGVLLPNVPCRSVTARDRAALRLGPDEWLVLAPEEAAHLAGQATEALAGAPASIVDVSHRALSIEIAGPRAVWCLNAFCALDLDARAFPVGMCTRTVLAKAEIVLWRIGMETFHIEVARSFAPYLRLCLEEAAREFLGREAMC